VGFQQLERRVKMQDDKMNEQDAVMKSFENEIIRMREFQVWSCDMYIVNTYLN